MSEPYFVPGRRGPQVYRPPEAHADDLDGLLGEPVRDGDDLFWRIGDLARALNRKPVTIRSLHSSGVIPQPTFSMDANIIGGRIRLYSRHQIEQARKIAREEGILIDTTKPIKTTRFAERLREAWNEDQ